MSTISAVFSGQRKIDRPRVSRKCTIVGFVLLAAFGPAFALGQESVASRSQELLERANEESAAAMSAGMQGDQTKFQEHSVRALELTSEARSLFDSVNAAESDDVTLLMAYARFLRDEANYDLAADALIRAAALQPENPELWFTLGEVQALLGTEGEERAVQSLRKALSLNAGDTLDAKAHAALGALFYQQGLYDFARDNLQAALESDPQYVGARITLASLDVRDGHISAASDSLDALGQISPQSVSLMQRTMDRALLDFEESRRWMPDTAGNHLAYAKLLVRAGRMGDSLLPLERATELDPMNPVAFNLLGSIHRELGNVEAARQAFSKSLKLNPDQPRTQSALDELETAPTSNSPPTPLAP